MYVVVKNLCAPLSSAYRAILTSASRSGCLIPFTGFLATDKHGITGQSESG